VDLDACPLVPCVWIIRTVGRDLRRADEFTRLRQLEAMAVGFGVAMAMLLTRGFEVSRQPVNAIETGRYDPNLPLAFRLAGLFDRPIELLFEPDKTTSG
jgi:putative transcriptional regulator